MRFGDIAKFLAACSELAAALGRETNGELVGLLLVLQHHPDEKTLAVAKRLGKQSRVAGTGIAALAPVVAFCRVAGFAKHEKALAELQACTVKFGLNTPQDFQTAIEAPLVSTNKPKKASHPTLTTDYAGQLLVGGLSYADATRIIAEIDGDKRVKVNEAREIASHLLGVQLSKGRTRPQYIEDMKSKFIISGREDHKREVSQSTSKPWGDV
jgi:hypothetical protein